MPTRRIKFDEDMRKLLSAVCLVLLTEPYEVERLTVASPVPSCVPLCSGQSCDIGRQLILHGYATLKISTRRKILAFPTLCASQLPGLAHLAKTSRASAAAIIHRMFAQGRRRISIHTARENDCVLIESPDDGHGVPEGVRDLAFELFFTKDVGKGTGIGLDVNPIVVVHYGGDIRFTSAPGDTRFKIRLSMDGSFDGKATRNIVWSPAVGQ